MSAGTLIATAVVNPKVASELMRTELVLADDTGENQKSVKELIPDWNLRVVISVALGKSVFRLMPEDLKSEKLTELLLWGNQFYSLEGIENITALKKLTIIDTSIEDISMLEKISGLNQLVLSGNKITNFDVLSKISGTKNVKSNVELLKDNIELDAYNSTIDLSESIGDSVSNKITINELTVNGKTVKPVFDGNRKIVFDDLLNNSNKSADGKSFGEIKVVLKQNLDNLFLWGITSDVTTTIIQPYTINEYAPVLKVSGSTLNDGDTWKPSANIETATDKFKKQIPLEEIKVEIDGVKMKVTEDVDGLTEGTHTVIYTYELNSEVLATATTTVVVNDTGEPDTGEPDTGEPDTGEPGAEKPNIEVIPKTDIMTNKPTLDIYNSEGKKTGTKKLTDEITDFTTEKVNKLDSGEYYQIGDNEWVSAKDVAVFEYTDSYIQTHGSKVKNLTDFGNTGTLTDRALDKSSSWYTDRSAYFDGEWHHRVSTHEWVHDDHVVKYEIASGVVNATETATLYNSKGKKVTDRALAKGSTFFTDRKATIDGKLMHRVSTDEWVDADTVTFK
ncbi:SLAP domain-containing protein [Companilactobacillus muriivasis]|uniref:SLAP domain-containing protein n=1 Tax=Companilactobacillus muriivasis TaxID=3081444 RepID=UPI0030C7305C